MRALSLGLMALALLAAACSSGEGEADGLGSDEGGGAGAVEAGAAALTNPAGPDAAADEPADTAEGDDAGGYSGAATDDPPPLRILVAGDSYSSGEGLPDADGPCSRSPAAYAVRSAELLSVVQEIDHVVLAACTGAESTAWADQLASWPRPEPPNLIVATFGGNDVGFADVLLDCLGLDDGAEAFSGEDGGGLRAATDFLRNRGCDVSESDVDERMGGLATRLEPIYREMSAIVGDDGRVMVLGYPAPLAHPDTWAGPLCDGIGADDARFLRRASDRLNESIAAATEVAANVYFVEVASTFDGHERCSPEPWLFGLEDIMGSDGTDGEPARRLSLQRPFHPTDDGHRALALLLTQAVRAAR